MRRVATLSLALWVLLAQGAAAQSLMERSPNLQAGWSLATGAPAFVFAHRFELLSGGDELLNIPTLTLAVGLPLGLAAGLDFSSNSEILLDRTGTNETQYWLGGTRRLGAATSASALLAYNSAAGSVDGALTARRGFGPLTLLGELRGFSDLFGRGSAGAAAAGGALLHATPHLALTADVGRVVTEDSLPSVWSAGVAISIPGTPHTMSLQAGNGGALTLQGTSRSKTRDFSPRRYGFVFTVPLGTGSQWSRVFRPAPPPEPPPADSVVRVEIRLVAYQPQEIRIRPGQTVEWVNRDPIEHTVTADDGSWGSELLPEGGRYSRRFDRPGRYSYHCLPHPMMKGVVVVGGERVTGNW